MTSMCGSTTSACWPKLWSRKMLITRSVTAPHEWLMDDRARGLRVDPCMCTAKDGGCCPWWRMFSSAPVMVRIGRRLGTLATTWDAHTNFLLTNRLIICIQCCSKLLDPGKININRYILYFSYHHSCDVFCVNYYTTVLYYLDCTSNQIKLIGSLVIVFFIIQF